MIHNVYELCQEYIARLYHNVQGHGPKIEKNRSIPKTYGEILYPAMDKLLSAVEFSSQDIFIDLGSGLGKIVIQVFLRTEVKAAIGIEIMPRLHHQALTAAARVREDLPTFYEQARKLEFILGDFLNTSLDEASIILLGSPCFSPRMLARIANMINEKKQIRLVLSLRPLIHLQRLKFIKAMRIEGSWDTTLCYIYGL